MKTTTFAVNNDKADNHAEEIWFLKPEDRRDILSLAMNDHYLETKTEYRGRKCKPYVTESEDYHKAVELFSTFEWDEVPIRFKPSIIKAIRLLEKENVL